MRRASADSTRSRSTRITDDNDIDVETLAPGDEMLASYVAEAREGCWTTLQSMGHSRTQSFFITSTQALPITFVVKYRTGVTARRWWRIPQPAYDVPCPT
jgi:hypothetical protein